MSAYIKKRFKSSGLDILRDTLPDTYMTPQYNFMLFITDRAHIDLSDYKDDGNVIINDSIIANAFEVDLAFVNEDESNDSFYHFINYALLKGLQINQLPPDRKDFGVLEFSFRERLKSWQ
jgi:hypothetical protein